MAYLFRAIFLIVLFSFSFVLKSMNISERLAYAKSLNGVNDVEMLRISDSISLLFLERNIEPVTDDFYLSSYLKSRVLNRQGKLDECISFLDQVIGYDSKLLNSENYGYLYLIKGIAYKKQAKTQASLESYSRAIQIFEASSSCKALVKARNNLANYYNSLSLFEEAIKQYQLSIEVLSQCPNKYQHAVINRNLAGLYFNFEKNTEKSILLFKDALSDFNTLEKNEKNNNHIISILNQLTLLSLVLKDNIEAEKYLKNVNDVLTLKTPQYLLFLSDLNRTNLQVLNKQRSEANKSFTILEEKVEKSSSLQQYKPRLYIEYAEFLLKNYKSGKYSQIELLLNKALSLAFAHNKIESQAQIALIRSKMYEKNFQFEKAFSALNTYQELKERILDKENIRVLQSKKYQLTLIKQENKRKVETLEQQKAFQKNLAEKNILEKQMLKLVVFGLIFFSILIGVIFWIYTKQKKISINKLKLESKNSELELSISNLEREEEYKLFQNSIESKKEEQNRISRNLHDNIGANLAAIKLALDDDKDSVFGQLIDNVYLEVRNLSYELNELSQTKDLFPQMIKAYLSNIESISNISIHYEVYPDVDFEKIQSVNKREIFSIIRELVNNTLKHSNSKSIEIIISKENENLHLYIEDFGKGFDQKKVRLGLGLQNVQKRVSLLDGSCEIDAREGRGVIINIEIPF